MLIPFSMFLLDSDQGKVKFSPLYGPGRKVTILIARHFQSGMLPIERASISIFLLDSDQGKVKYSPLYGRESKVTVFVGRHFQSGMLPIERPSKKT